MSGGNICFELQFGEFSELLNAANAGPTKMLGGFLNIGNTVPSDAAAGYPKGALFIHKDATDQSDALYCNIGTITSCNFNLVTVAAG